MRGRLTVFVLAIVTGLLVGIASPGSANIITKKDGNDTKGPLDLAAIKVSHKPGASVFTFTTIGAFSNADVTLKKSHLEGLFEVALDTNADQRFNDYADVFFAAGRFRGVLYKPGGTVITYNLKAARVSKRAVKVTIPHSKFVNKGSYDFAGFSAYFDSPCTRKKPCLDAIPNRFPLMRHDFTAPTITWGSVPTFSSDVSATLTFPVPFSLKDDLYGSGVKSWSLQRKEVGTPTWVVVKIGKTLSPIVSVLGEQGKTYDLRVVAVDRQGNKTKSSLKRTAVPFDDRNPDFVYSVAATQNVPASAFLSTTSSIANTQTVTKTGLGRWDSLCVLGGPTTGPAATATISVNGTDQGVTMNEDGSTAARATLHCVSANPGTGNTVVITSTSAEPFVFDGLAVMSY